jgi:hypothetical protein
LVVRVFLAHAASLRHTSFFARLKFKGFLHSFKTARMGHPTSKAQLQRPNFKGPTSKAQLQRPNFKGPTSKAQLQRPNFKGPTSKTQLQRPNFKDPTSKTQLQRLNFKDPTSKAQLQRRKASRLWPVTDLRHEWRITDSSSRAREQCGRGRRIGYTMRAISRKFPVNSERLRNLETRWRQL